MIAAGLDPDAIPKNATAVENWEAGLEWKASYLTQRRAMTHDIHHTVTNFGTDLPGEVGLSAVYLAQIHQPVSLLYLAAVLLHAMAKSQEYKQALQTLSVGLEMGQQARNLLAQKWETGWERPLSEWREKLSIVPIAV
jgi:ubiquinone biosynthesis protein Coq4